MPADKPVPDGIPGQLIQDPEHLYQLKSHLAGMCNLSSHRFPGSQPVSFDRGSLQLLEKEECVPSRVVWFSPWEDGMLTFSLRGNDGWNSFWVCEKSDGVRVLVLIVATPEGQEIYLIDRREDFYRNEGLTFPHQDGPEYNHSNTLLDGELVIDVDPRSGQHTLRLLAFDLLVCDGENLMHKSLSSRYGRLRAWVVTPYNKLLQSRPELMQYQPFEVLLKPQELAYGIEAVFKEHLPKLQHGNDGLIFTSAEAPYTPGTDQKILKWKPPSENSIDFLLSLKFPPLADDPDACDFSKKPLFMLLMNHGSGGNHYFDMMDVDDKTWEEWKASGEQYDDRIIEVVWDKEEENWKMLRFRDDKREGNYKTVVTSIIQSIQHGVEKEDVRSFYPRFLVQSSFIDASPIHSQLIAYAGKIKSAWKARAAARQTDEEKREAERKAEQTRREGIDKPINGDARAREETGNGNGSHPPPATLPPQKYSGSAVVAGLKR